MLSRTKPKGSDLAELEDLCRKIEELETFVSERKQTEEKLRAELANAQSLIKALQLSQDQFHTLLTRIPLGVFRCGPDGKMISANPALVELLGCESEEELLAINAFEFYQDLELKSDVLERLLKEEMIAGLEVPVRRKDGGRIWTLTNLFTVTEEPGNFMYLEGAVQDITERKNMEKELREREEKYRLIVENAVTPIEYFDLEGHLLFINQTGARNLGGKPEDFVGKMLEEFLPDIAEQTRERFREVLESGDAKAYEDYFELLPGEMWFHSNFQPVRDTTGATVAIQVISVDISAWKRAEKELSESEDRFRTLFEHAVDYILLMDPLNASGPIIVDVNEAACKMHGYTREEMIGMPIARLNTEKGRIHIKDRVRRLHLGEALTFETVHVKKNGSIFPVEVSSRLIQIGNKSFIMSIERDITERKRAEEERREIEARLLQAQKLESLGILAGGIAHDFNNLLTGVLGNVGLALADLPADSPLRASLEDIELSARRANDLTRQMLAYSGRGQFVVKSVDLNSLIEEMAQLLRSSVSRKVSFNVNLEKNLPAVKADSTQMQQIVMNLIVNASEACEDREIATVAVRTGVRECSREYLSRSYLDELQPAGRYVFVEVTDTGEGMDEGTRSRVFEPFYTTKFTGRGLGLAAVLGIVRGHKGAIMVESQPGQGSTFRVLLPALDTNAEPPRKTVEKEIDKNWKPGGKVLLIDDEPFVRDVGLRTLEMTGFEVTTAADGREGLEIFRQQEGELVCVVLDLTMPQMGGEEVLREIRKINVRVPVLITSGYSELDVMPRFDDESVSGFIHKPFRPDDLIEKLRQVLGSKKTV